MKIIEFLKKKIEVWNNDFSFLHVGDIIWARRYITQEDKRKMKEGHQESPYVIIKKTNQKVYGLQCTSNPHQEIKWKMVYYPLGRLNYDMLKNSYINCTCVHELKEIQFVETIGHLKEYDLNQLKKQLYILKNSNFKRKPDIEDKYLDFKIGIGDVLLYNNSRYYIYDKKDKEYETFKLRNSIKKNRCVTINNSYYSFLFENIEVIKRKSKYTLVDTFHTGEIEIINEYRKKDLEQLKNRNKSENSLRIGALIEYNAHLFYIYDEKERCLFMYRIFPSTTFEKKMATILVQGGRYNTFFNTVEVSREKLESQGYKIKRCAGEEEIKYNKNIFTLPKRERGNVRKKLNSSCPNTEENIDNFVPKVILKNGNTGEYYLILSREGDVVELVNINDISDTFYCSLEKGQYLFRYYRVLAKEEYDKYLEKIEELKDIAKMFDK